MPYYLPVNQSSRELQARLTKAKLRDLAVKMIREKGYHQVTISEICKGAKVAKGTFYLYFSSKKDILFEILAAINRDMFAEKTWEGQSDPALRLREFCRCYILVVTKQGYEFSREIIKIILDQHPDPNLVESDQHWQTIHSVIVEGQDTGLFRKIDPTLTADIVQDFLFGSIQRWCAQNGAFSIEDYVLERFSVIESLLRL